MLQYLHGNLQIWLIRRIVSRPSFYVGPHQDWHPTRDSAGSEGTGQATCHRETPSFGVDLVPNVSVGHCATVDDQYTRLRDTTEVPSTGILALTKLVTMKDQTGTQRGVAVGLSNFARCSSQAPKAPDVDRALV